MPGDQPTVRIGVIGDFTPENRTHVATNASIDHAAGHLGVRVETCWLPTPSLLTAEGQEAMERCGGLWASPGSPYQSMEGALEGIRFARERGRPFVGT